MSAVDNVIEAAALFKSKKAAVKLNAIIKAQALLNELSTTISEENKAHKRLIIEAFTKAILESVND